MSSAVVIWVWLCAYLNCAGWVLSALHELNMRGYAVVFALGWGLFFFWQKNSSTPFFPKPNLRKWRWRGRHAFPLAFFILAALAFLGGALHSPANYDTLAYRTPRVLHWLAEGQWHWIHSEFARLNTRTAGFEWVTAPVILFSKTDHLIFLLNIIPFLLLPGRMFAVLTRLGVRSRTAWYWMWLLPSGYGYVLQAGSVVNDLFGALMALTAFEFALRARQGNKVSDLWTSGLALALMTSVKAYNIVLLLPWVIIVWPTALRLLRRPLAAAMVVLLAAGASILPTAVLNYRACGDWTGLKVEQGTVGGGAKGIRFLANALNLTVNNLVPPVFPFVAQWDWLVQRTLPTKLQQDFRANMEGGLAGIKLPDMQVEESAGLGMGVTLLLLVLLVKKIGAGRLWPKAFWTLPTLVPLAAWASLGVFMMETGAAGPARYLLPFYPLLIVPLLTGPAANQFFQSRWWRGAALGVFALAGMLLIISPPRPLWPAVTVLKCLRADQTNHFWLKRAWNVYSTYGSRADGFAPVIAMLPPEAEPLGFIGNDEPEAGLWRPFGARRILHFCRDDSAADLRARGIKYALVSSRFFEEHCHYKVDLWVAKMNVQIVQEFQLKLQAGQPPRSWLLVRVP